MSAHLQNDTSAFGTVIFDLDGTLLDTREGIIGSVIHAANQLGYPSLSNSQLLSFIGPPLKDSFMRCYQCREDEAARLVAEYRSHYQNGAMFLAAPYAGVEEMCKGLVAHDLRLMVATSKPEVFSRQIVRRFRLDSFFDAVHGPALGCGETKANLIRQCVREAGTDCVMVGDTLYDAKGAHEAGVFFIGATYGFGSAAEMKQYPHVALAASPLEVRDTLLKCKGVRYG